MEEDGQQTQLEHFLGQKRLGLGGLAPLQDEHQTEGSLQRVLEIVVSGINRLVIRVVAGEALFGPLKSLRHKTVPHLRKQPSIHLLHPVLDRAWNSSIDRT